MSNEKGEKKEHVVKRKRKKELEVKMEVLSKRENKGRMEGGREGGGGSMSNRPKRRIRHGRLWLRNISAII
jgi:hypothetical protein